MTAALPPDGFRIFSATDDPGSDLPRRHAAWIEASQPALALVHADPRCPDLPKAAIDVAAASGAFLVGGLVSHRCPSPLVARQPRPRDSLGGNGMAGLMLAPGISVATGLTQGCMPIGPVHRIDEARDNIVMVIDGRPALDRFHRGYRARARPRFAAGRRADLRRTAGRRLGYRRLSRAQSARRSIPGRGWLVLGAEIAPGDRDPVLPARSRERAPRHGPHGAASSPAGSADRRRRGSMSAASRGARRCSAKPRVETRLIREGLGEFPLIGFFANGEISRDRLYGHTGVLTLFT